MTSRVLGVDFSGAADAGRACWLTEARHTPDGLVVEDCYRAADEWGVDRERAHAGLRDRARAFDVAGFDFPFSLPQGLLDEHCGGTWRGLVEWLAGGGPDDPDAFASTCRSTAREHTGDGTASLRRETDHRRAALCPYDEIVKHQTFHGVRDVLGAFVDDPAVAVAPMQGPGRSGAATGGSGSDGGREATAADATATRVVEVYPAATFGWLGLYREGYKGDRRERRATNVDGVEACSVDLGGFRETYERDHDALDSLAAVVSAARSTTGDPPRHGPREEGHIYV